jgi:hypothetical protein
MHRTLQPTLYCVSLVAALCAACGGGKKPAEDVSNAETDAGAEVDGGVAEKKDDCAGFDISNLEDVLLKDACEEPNVKPDTISPVDLKGKLEVTLTASPTRIGVGGKADLLVTYSNKTKEPLVLHFKLDPMPRFEIEVWDQPKKKTPKRVDMPAGNPPSPPEGVNQPAPTEPKSARITLAPNGTARARVPWEALKTKWAPEKFRGASPERGFPRSPAGPLPKGKYTVKVVTPLAGVSEGVDHEMSTPKVDIEVGG